MRERQPIMDEPGITVDFVSRSILIEKNEIVHRRKLTRQWKKNIFNIGITSSNERSTHSPENEQISPEK